MSKFILFLNIDFSLENTSVAQINVVLLSDFQYESWEYLDCYLSTWSPPEWED